MSSVLMITVLMMTNAFIIEWTEMHRSRRIR
jgi:hypothetical protein